ncbi:hypothetical protein NW768_007338 [Fusarium equiseti]|uniref:Uncharacterized protein n=1 Tax=Fusarium equiseti TaxID=61235 RepID=A0ABQ8R7D0_FUSEQ|nr:hypothetical protein NW768_007338 [Fusarium equiseti]
MSSSRPLPPTALSLGASLIIFNHLDTAKQDTITGIKAMTAFATLISRWSLQPAPRECSLDRIRQCLVTRASQQGHAGILYASDIAQVHLQLFDLEAMEKRSGKRSIGVQTDEVPSKRRRRGPAPSPIMTEPVNVIDPCSDSEDEVKGQSESDESGDSSCSLGRIPPAPQPGPSLPNADSYDWAHNEVNVGRFEAFNGSNTIVENDDGTINEPNESLSESGASLYGPGRHAIQFSSSMSYGSEFPWHRSTPPYESMAYMMMTEEAYSHEYDDRVLDNALL